MPSALRNRGNSGSKGRSQMQQSSSAFSGFGTVILTTNQELFYFPYVRYNVGKGKICFPAERGTLFPEQFARLMIGDNETEHFLESYFMEKNWINDKANGILMKIRRRC